MLIMQINDKQLYILNSVQEPNTGAAWRSLQEFHTEKSKHVLRKLMRAFHELQIGTNEKLKTFIVRVNTLLVKITQHKKPNSVHPITEAMKSSAFLNALVKDIRFTTSLTILHMNKIDDAPLTFEQICDKLTSMHTALTEIPASGNSFFQKQSAFYTGTRQLPRPRPPLPRVLRVRVPVYLPRLPQKKGLRST